MNKKVLIAGGVIVAGGALYLAWKEVLGSKPEAGNTTQAASDTIVQPSSVKKLKTGNDNFPLQRNSTGNRVRLLQQAIQKKLGKVAFPDTDIDGVFGTRTESALVKAGYPVFISQEIFNQIINGTPKAVQAASVVTQRISPKQVSASLFNAISINNLDGVLAALRQIRDTYDYQLVNEFFENAQAFTVSKSIVTYLLDVAFAGDSYAKDKIKNEFRRIGLIQNIQTGSWSLPRSNEVAVSGFRFFKNLKTLADTYVTDSQNRKIRVKTNTLLGKYVRTKNGMSYFLGADKKLYSVPAVKVKTV